MKLSPVALAGKIDDNQRAVSRYQLIVVDVALAQAGRLALAGFTHGLGKGRYGNARKQGGDGYGTDHFTLLSPPHHDTRKAVFGISPKLT